MNSVNHTHDARQARLSIYRAAVLRGLDAMPDRAAHRNEDRTCFLRAADVMRTWYDLTVDDAKSDMRHVLCHSCAEAVVEALQRAEAGRLDEAAARLQREARKTTIPRKEIPCPRQR